MITRLWRLVLGIVDSIVAGTLVVATVALIFVYRRRKREVAPCLRLLVLDTAYSLRTIRARGLERFYTGWDLDGFFEHLWIAHPCVGASPDDAEDSAGGPISVSSLGPRHTMIEGKVGRFVWLRSFPRLNFALAQFSTWSYLNTLVWRAGISAIRVQDPYYLGLIGLGLAYANRLPLVIVIQGNYDLIYNSIHRPAYPRLFRWRRVEKWIGRFTLSRADLVVGGNQNTADFALANGAKKERTTVFRVGSAIDLAHFQVPESRRDLRAELDLVEKKTLLYIGRYEKVKHPEDIIKCLAAVSSTRSDVVALLVGDGAMRNELEALAQELGVQKRVYLLGNQKQEWICSLLASVDIVLAPLAGRALVESALAARPIVAYDVEWQSELIRDNETGVLVPYRDWEAMARAVLGLLDDPQRARRLGDAARILALEQHDPSALMENERVHYRKLLEQRIEAHGGTFGNQ